VIPGQVDDHVDRGFLGALDAKLPVVSAHRCLLPGRLRSVA
jgi:hypothetical protein